MNTTATFLMVLVLCLPTAFAQDYTQMNLPDGAIALLGKYRLGKVLYSPDGTRSLLVDSSIGYLALRYNDLSRDCPAFSVSRLGLGCSA